MSGMTEPNWSDGEGVTLGDLNSVSRNLGARLNDAMIAQLMQSTESLNNTSDAICWAVGKVGGFPYPLGLNALSCAGGTIAQSVGLGIIGGAVPSTLIYYLSPNEITFNTPLADAALNRIDSIFFQLAELVGQVATPAAPAIGNAGAAGVTTYGYKVVAVTTTGTVTAASAAGSTSTGNATLTATNYNTVTFALVVGAHQYRIYRTAGGATQGLIATVYGGANVVNDTGLAGDASTPPTVNTTGQTASRDFQDAVTLAKSSQTMNTGRVVVLSTQMLSSALGANPTAPATPAGWCRWADVYQPAGMGGAQIATTNVRDWRQPAGLEAWQQDGYTGRSSTWTVDATNLYMSAAAGGNVVNYPAPAPAFAGARLMSVMLAAKLAAGALVTLQQFDMGTPGSPAVLTQVQSLTAQLTLPMNGTVLLTFALPVWATGATCGQAFNLLYPTVPAKLLVLQITAGAAGDKVSAVRWLWGHQ